MKKTIVLLLALLSVALFSYPARALAGIDIGRSVAYGAGADYDDGRKDVVRFGEDVTVGKDQVIPGSLVVFGGDAVIEGTIEKDAVVFGGDVELKSTAHVKGNLVNFGGKVEKAAEAKIDGDEVFGNKVFGKGFRIPNWVTAWFWFLQGTLVLIGTMALAAIAVALFPEHTGRIATTGETEPWKSLGLGTLATLSIPIVMLALFITIVGIPVALLFLIAVPLVFLFAYIGAGRLIGKKVVDLLNVRSESPIIEVLVGILVLGLVGFVPVLGGIIKIIITLIGLGAVLITKFGTGRPWRKTVQVGDAETSAEA